jgi:exosortase A
MTKQRQTPRLVLLAIACVAYVLLYGPTWLDMERVWRSSATYNHCYLIIPIALYFFYCSKTTAESASRSSNGLWLPVLALFALQLIWLFGYAADVALLTHLAGVMTLQTLLWIALGNSNAKRHRFAIFYLIFLVPFGEELSPLLQNITADHTVMLLQAVNIPVFRDGLYLATPVGLFEVAEACSGLRFLIAALAISVLFAYLHYNRIWKQVLFVVLMALLSVLANGVRAFMLVYIGEKTAMQYGFGADHFVYGWLFFGLVLLAGFWLGARFADPLQPLVRSTRQHFQLQPLSLKLISAAILLLLTLSYRLSLKVVVPPQTASTIKLAFATEKAYNTNWGIRFVNSLAASHRLDSAGTEYFIARYGNKQQNGELVNWQNMLFDKQLWQVQQRTVQPQFAVLQLKNLFNEYRTVLYWYQIDEHRTASTIKSKVLQALTYLADDQSHAYIVAVSIPGPASERNLAILQRSAEKLHQHLLSPSNDKGGADE